MKVFEGPFWIAAEYENGFLKWADFSFFREPPQGERDRRIFFNYVFGRAPICWKRFPPLQRKIYKAVYRIPFGQTRTYGEIAKACGVYPRVVGMALKKNPLPPFIPCHRVVGKNDLGGFSKGIEEKKKILAFERWFSLFLYPMLQERYRVL